MSLKGFQLMLMMLALWFAESVKRLGRAAQLLYAGPGHERVSLKGLPADADDARSAVC